MLSSAQGRFLNGKRLVGPWNYRKGIRLCAFFFLCIVIVLQVLPFTPLPASAHVHVPSKVMRANYGCNQVTFSPDGNPYPLCPGVYPLGGNCVWWAWEQWHLLGYDLPRNWGNATSWAEDAQRAGFSVGTKPRVGAIAVFPRGDGYWASGAAGHVAFVTAVSSDGGVFDVTYQNYGDPTFMYTGTGYNVELINQPHFQNGQLRFIYFPRTIDSQVFAKLPGITASSGTIDGVNQANNDLNNGDENTSTSTGTVIQSTTMTTNRLALGGASASSSQQFNANFTGRGNGELLLYNRKQGTLKIFAFDGVPKKRSWRDLWLTSEEMGTNSTENNYVNLGDATTPAGKWGANLDVHIGYFSGEKTSEILLYDRVIGTLQLLSLTPELKIKKHVTIPNIGKGWEVSQGRFNGKSDGLFLYQRYANPDLANTDDDSTDTGSEGVVPTPVVTPPPVLIPTPTPSPVVTLIPTPQPTRTPTQTTQPTRTPVVTPTPTPTPQSTPTPVVKPTQQPTAAVTPTPTATATQPTATAVPTPATTPQATQTVEVTPTATTQALPIPRLDKTEPEESTELKNWRKNGRSANVLLLDFDQNLKIHHRQEYSLWHASWEVYTGSFASSTQDGIFLYDRIMGEGRIFDFDSQLRVRNYEEMHDLDGNWIVYSGDFANKGQSQILLYEPSVGDIQLFAFDNKLKVASEKQHSGLGEHQVLYVGYFGLPNLGIMLYDAQSAQSTFIGFDASLDIAHEHLIKTWDQRWQVLGSGFQRQGLCNEQKVCAKTDTILVLNRQSGQIEQYVFSFGRSFTLYDNRVQAYKRQGVPVNERVTTVDTSNFSMLRALSTTISDEELY